jgi:glycosyltransferase involved in cell wall biosynthesis
MSNRKVCILTSVHSPFDTRIFHKQAKTLAKAGYEVALIAQHDKDEIVDGIKIVALPRPRNRFWRMLGTWRVFRLALKQKADIYHFHDPELLPTGLLLKLITQSRVIYDVHEDYPEAILTKHWLPSLARKPVACFFNFLEKWAASQLDYTIAATDDIAGKFESKGKVTTIKNYPILERFDSAFRRDIERPTLIYVGGLSQTRGISEIVQAMSYLDSSSEAKLVLYGKFEPANYRDILKELNGFKKVAYRGWIEPEQVWLNMHKATIGMVCIHPVERYRIALPVKLFEYMAAGLPVIASNFPLWKEIVEGNNCGLTVNPLDPREIARAVEYLLGHPDEARKMGENGRKAVMEKYNWETESQKLLDLYEDLLNRR